MSLNNLKERFNKTPDLHSHLKWEDLEASLNKYEAIILKMEETMGEPHVIEFNNDVYVVDLYKESPKERCSLCYDKEARINRKKNAPESSAMEEVEKLGTQLMDEMIYQHLQSLVDIDLKTSCWLKTPMEVREKGGALFGDKRYGRCFIYHNGADSYYGVRSFRSMIKLAL